MIAEHLPIISEVYYFIDKALLMECFYFLDYNPLNYAGDQEQEMYAVLVQCYKLCKSSATRL